MILDILTEALRRGYRNIIDDAELELLELPDGDARDRMLHTIASFKARLAELDS